MASGTSQISERYQTIKLPGLLGATGVVRDRAIWQASLLGLVVIPELRISDKGLVDVTNFDFISVLDD